MNKIAITGANGFIGQNLLKILPNALLFDYEERWEIFKGVWDVIIHLGARSSTMNTDFEQIIKDNYNYSVTYTQDSDLYLYNPSTDSFISIKHSL